MRACATWHLWPLPTATPFLPPGLSTPAKHTKHCACKLFTPPPVPLPAGAIFTLQTAAVLTPMRQWQQVAQAVLNPALQGFMNSMFMPMPFKWVTQLRRMLCARMAR